MPYGLISIAFKWQEIWRMQESKIPKTTQEEVRISAEKYIVGVVDKSIEFYGIHSRRNNFLYNASRIGIVVFSLSLPAIVTIAQSYQSPLASLVVLVLPVLIAVLAALDSFFHWGELWMSRTATQLALQRIKREFWADWKSIQFESQEARSKVAYQKYRELVKQVEGLMEEEEQAFWGRRIQKLKHEIK